MMARQLDERPSRGHKKRERTRRQLLAAGVETLAEKGEALTISDVVARAEVSNGTFYNYFADRDELIDALAEHSLLSLAAEADDHTAEEDPALRFAVATLRVLHRAADDRTWGRAVLRLADHQRSTGRELDRFLREDLATGLERGRFALGPDDITLDSIVGLIMMSIRRIVRGEAGPRYAERVTERALTTVGVTRDEAAALVAHAVTDRERRVG